MSEQTKKPDIFDRIMSAKIFRPIQPFYKKYKEILMYLFFGACTTIVGIIFFALPIKVLNLPDFKILGITIDADVQVSNVISWICAVTFAYVTNRTWVFEDKAYGARKIAAECAAFFAGRLVTLIIENILLQLSVETLGWNDILAKCVVSVVTIILNYVISKIFVFKKK